jgi:elongation factor P
MKESAANLTKGMYLKYKGKYVQVVSNNHVKIAMRGAMFRLEYADLLSGVKFEENLKPSAEFEVIEASMVDSTFSRIEDDKLVFVNDETEEEFTVPKHMVTAWGYLKEGDECMVRFAEEDVMGVQVPQYSDVEVLEKLQDGKVRVTGGYVIKGVPQHVDKGQTIVIRTADNSFKGKK